MSSYEVAKKVTDPHHHDACVVLLLSSFYGRNDTILTFATRKLATTKNIMRRARESLKGGTIMFLAKRRRAREIIFSWRGFGPPASTEIWQTKLSLVYLWKCRIKISLSIRAPTREVARAGHSGEHHSNFGQEERDHLVSRRRTSLDNALSWKRKSVVLK